MWRVICVLKALNEQVYIGKAKNNRMDYEEMYIIAFLSCYF